MPPSRSIVIADIHGCSRTFLKLLKSVRLTKDDALYLLGDFIDRGQDSKGVLDAIMLMQREGFRVHPLRGNHEDMLLKVIQSGSDEDLWDWMRNGGDKTLASFSIDHPRMMPQNYQAFLQKLPLYYLTDTHILVHAGLDFRLDDPFSDQGEVAMLWKRSQGYDSDKAGGRKVVVGHTIRTIQEIRESLNTMVINLDNGCYLGPGYQDKGRLVAMELATNRLWFQEHVDRNYLLRRWYEMSR